MLRCLVADDSFIVREGVRQLIATSPDIEVVAACNDLGSTLAAIADLRPDVVVADIRMPPTNTDEGISLALRLRSEWPEMGVVILSQYADAEYALALLDKGAAGRAFLLKERISDLDQLLNAIREVARGGSVIDPAVVENLVAARTVGRQRSIDQLTARENEVLEQVAQGKNNAAVAAALFLSEHAVEKHINSIFSRLGLSGEQDVHRRVKATLTYLAAQAPRQR